MNEVLILAQEFEFFLEKRSSVLTLSVAHERVTEVRTLTSTLHFNVLEVVEVTRASSRLGPLVAVAARPVGASVGHTRFVFHAILYTPSGECQAGNWKSITHRRHVDPSKSPRVATVARPAWLSYWSSRPVAAERLTGGLEELIRGHVLSVEQSKSDLAKLHSKFLDVVRSLIRFHKTLFAVHDVQNHVSDIDAILRGARFVVHDCSIAQGARLSSPAPVLFHIAREENDHVPHNGLPHQQRRHDVLHRVVLTEGFVVAPQFHGTIRAHDERTTVRPDSLVPILPSVADLFDVVPAIRSQYGSFHATV